MLEQRENIEAALSDVIQFEEALGNITAKPLDSSNLVAFKISQLASDFSFVNWTSFFQSAFTDALTDATNESMPLNLDENTEILIQVKQRDFRVPTDRQ